MLVSCGHHPISRVEYKKEMKAPASLWINLTVCYADAMFTPDRESECS